MLKAQAHMASTITLFFSQLHPGKLSTWVVFGCFILFVFIEARQHGVCDVGSACISLTMRLARQGTAAGQSPNAAHT